MRGRSTIVGLLCAALLAVTTAGAGVVRQITDDLTVTAGPGALDDAGSAVFTGSSGDPLGTNPEHAFRIVRFDAVTGAPTELLSHPRGVAATVSVSDDGAWLAFVSSADLTGDNHDLSPELFVMRDDGTGLAQLTDDPAVNAGSVSGATISGDATRVLFTANTDPLGTNPLQRTQLFAIDRDGSGLVQLTAFAAGSIGGSGISDDAARVVFAHDGDPLGLDPDLGGEIFAVDADGTNLRQLTSTPAGFSSGAPSLSGNGQKIAFQSAADLVGSNTANRTEIFAVDWDGTNLVQVTSSQALFGFTGEPGAQAPSITDDGLTVFFHSNHNTLFVNFDGNFEIFRRNVDGTGFGAITATLLNVGSLLPSVSGDGSRVSYLTVDNTANLMVEAGGGGGERQLVVYETILSTAPDTSADGSRVVFLKTTGLLAPSQLWRVQTDGSDETQLTTLTSGGAGSPSIAGDNDTIVFSADSDPAGGNADLSEEIFRIRADGTGLQQLTTGPAGTASTNPAISGDAGRVVFDSDADPLGGNLDGSREIFGMLADGSGLIQLTSGPAATLSQRPRVDGSGGWVVFESDADLDGGNPDGSFEIYRVRSDGTLLERLTGDAVLDSRAPDVSSAGDRVVFESAADLAGGNPELNLEVLVWDANTLTTTPLTLTLEGSSGGARISADGAWVHFSSTAALLEDDPDAPADLYRVPSGGGAVERIGPPRAALPSLGLLPLGGSGSVSPDDAGDVSVFAGLGDFTGGNPDLLSELWAIDRLASPRFEVGKPSPTLLTWDPEPGPLRYDVIRGDVAALAFDGAADVDLGAVACLEDDSPDTDTAGFEDPVDPAPGQAWFFVYRGSQGLSAGPGSYGRSSGGGERLAASGDCAP